jgi:hypothetical protein
MINALSFFGFIRRKIKKTGEKRKNLKIIQYI